MLSVSAVNEYGYSIDFSQDTELVVIDIDGLHPIKTTINSSPIPGYRASLYNSTSFENRNIVLSIAINDYNSNGRNKLNQVFSTGSKVTLTVGNYQIDGYIESNEYNPFNSKIIAQISIVCLQPYFCNGISNKVKITNIVNNFIFPFSAPASGITLGNIKDSYLTNVVNLGDVPCGCTIKAAFNSQVNSFVIYNEDKNQEIGIEYEFEQGDELLIDTRFTNKSGYISGPSTNYEKEDLMHYIYNITNWIEIDVGNNYIGYMNSSSSESDNSNIDVYVEFSEMVGGL